MKTLSSNAATVIDGMSQAPIGILSLAFTAPSSRTLYFSTRSFFPRNTFNSNVYDPLILSISNIQYGDIDHKSHTVGINSMIFRIANHIPVGGYNRFTDFLAAFTWSFVAATFQFVHEGAMASGDEVGIITGEIENIEGMSPESVSVRVSGKILGLASKWPYTIVNTTDYAGADPDDVGKMLPQVWGSCYRVPFRAVDAGQITTLAQDLAAAYTGNVNVTDTTGFPGGGLTAQIDAEKVLYTVIDGDTINISARAQGGTSDVAHDLGAKVAEIQTTYFYIIGHAVKAINAVYVDNVLQPAANYTVYTGQAASQHATYGAKAVIAFNTLPILTKQINVDANDTIDVTGADAITDGITVSDNITVTAATGSGFKNLIPTAHSSAGVTNPANAYDEDIDTYATITPAGGLQYLRLTIPTTDYGTITKKWFCFYATLGTGITINIKRNNGATAVATVTGPDDARHEYRVPTGDVSWSTNYDLQEPSDVVYIQEAWVEVEFTPDLTKTGNAYKTGSDSLTGGPAVKEGTVTLSGNSVADTVIGGLVSADVDGYQDDGSGTYTGTPSALIERPDHVFHHWLVGMLGRAAAELDLAGTYTDSGTSYAGVSFKLAVCLTEPPDVRNLLAEASRESRSFEIWEAGIHHLKYIEDTPASVRTVPAAKIIANSISLEYTIRREVFNTVKGLYLLYHAHYSGDDAFRAIVNDSDATSVTKYGTINHEERLIHVSDSTHATNITDWLTSRFANQKLMITFETSHSMVDLERGDVIELEVTDTYLNKDLLGLVASGDKFIVIGKSINVDFTETFTVISA